MRGANGQVAHAHAAREAALHELRGQHAWEHTTVDDTLPYVSVSDRAAESNDVERPVTAPERLDHAVGSGLRERRLAGAAGGWAGSSGQKRVAVLKRLRCHRHFSSRQRRARRDTEQLSNFANTALSRDMVLLLLPKF